MYAFGGVNSVNTIFMVFISLALSLFEVVVFTWSCLFVYTSSLLASQA